MAAETEQWLTSSSRSKQVLHALGSFKLLQSKADKMLRVRTTQRKADKESRVPEHICPVHVQHDIWLVLLEGAVHLVQQPLVAANVGC